MHRPSRLRLQDRLAAAFLLLLLALGSLALWIAVPAGALWAVSRVTDSIPEHFLAAVFAIPVAMIAFGAALAWINALYLRVTGSIRYPGEEEEDALPIRLRGPLELFLVVSFVLAVISISVWFFFFAENPPQRFF